MPDPTLARWGRNITVQRELLTPDGDRRRNQLAPCMSQANLGEALEPPVTQATVSRWETGKMEPHRRYKVQIAAHLGVDPSALFPLPQVEVA